jgi:hypothetical protein
MPNKHPLMKLSTEEEIFLRHWIFDETHFLDGQGPAKRIQVAKQVAPADLAFLIAAALPGLAEQEAAGQGPPPITEPAWPWTQEAFSLRLADARAILAQRQHFPACQVACPNPTSPLTR